MSLTGSAFLLFLGVVIAPFFAQAQNVCLLPSNVISNNTNYTLTVSSGNLTNATTYTVTLSTILNVRVGVLLQAMASGAAVGNWSVTNTNCSSAFGANYTLNSSTPLVAMWTSPANLTVNSVNISALVNDYSAMYLYSSTLSVAAVSNLTVTTTPTTTTKTAPTVTKSGGHANNPTSIVLALCLLAISSKIL